MVENCKAHRNYLTFTGMVDEFHDCQRCLNEGNESEDFETRYYFDVDNDHKVTTISSEVFGI